VPLTIQPAAQHILTVCYCFPPNTNTLQPSFSLSQVHDSYLTFHQTEFS